MPPEASLAQATGSQSRSVPTFGSTPPARTGSTASDPRKRSDTVMSDEPSKPVAVPITQTEPSSLRSHRSDSNDFPNPPVGSVQDMSYLTRPPRLPLPIEEEVHTPGSPIIAPADLGEPLEVLDGLDVNEYQRSGSILSSTTLDEEDAEELRVDRTRPVVPTRLEWLRGGDKVYVTGTIFQWNRKTRLQPVEGRPGVFACTVNILPGTHHIRFLVDGEMQTSPDLPTTVDFGNNLVNYIEVSPDDVPTNDKSTAGAEKEKELEQDKSTQAPTGSHNPPQGDEMARRRKPAPPLESYSNEIAKYLVDFDQADENAEYQDGIAAVEKLPTPPGLPGFLGKPILNHSTLIKDDNSVLNMPNHTVLNHLATSSIRHGILAVSATTRYRNKYVTTIIYKPANVEQE